jgi:hypothetical protein
MLFNSSFHSPNSSINRWIFCDTLFANPNGTQIKRAEPPHEGELYHVSVHEEELHSAAACTARDRLNGSIGGRVVGR